MDIQKALAACLARLMAERGLTIAQLSRQSGVSQGTIRSILHPGTRETGVETVLRLLRAMDLTAPDFFSAPEFRNP